jgi:sterol desaturase/sphingolipid hydroxylase (fatty acid hydroxylase superfamily)
MLARLLGAGVTLVGLAVVYGALERNFPARPTRRWRDADVLADACFFFGQYLVWSTLAVSLLGSVHGVLDAHAWHALREAAAAMPLWLLALFAVALGDVLVYWLHRACHRFELLWRFHAVHHSSERLDWLAAHREHPIDGMLTQLAQNLPAMVVGLPFEVLAVLIAFRGAWAILIHSNVRLPLGPLRLLCGSPELHHFHHARVERTAYNFANLAPWLDVVFGTYRRPSNTERYELGLAQPWPKGYLAQLVRPLWPEGALGPIPSARALWQRTRAAEPLRRA